MPRLSGSALSVKFVESARPPKSGYIEHADAAMRGMVLRVYASGAKAFILSTRVNGKQTRIKVGDAAGLAAVSLADARRIAGDAKDRAKAGLTPIPEAAPAPPGAKTFGPLAEDYIKREVPGLARGKEIASLIRRQILPDWKDRPVDKLRKRDAIELTDKLVDAGKPAAAYRLYETIKRVFNWIEERDEIDVNAMAGLKPPTKKKRRSRVLSDDEIKAVWVAADTAAYPFGDFVKLLFLTGQRRGEVSGMRRREVDLDKAAWVIPEDRTKSRRAQLVPLSDRAVDMLRSLPRFGGNNPEHDFVFTTTLGERPISGFSKMRRRFNKGCGVLGWVLHDLRRTCRTSLARLGVVEIVAERVIGHGPKGLVAVYNLHEYEAEKRDALNRWARHIDLILTPPPPNVVKMKRKQRAG